MKKLIILSCVSVFALSSFTTKETKKEVTVTVEKSNVKMTTWKLMCGSRVTGYLTCDCTYQYALLVAETLCQ